MAPEGLRIAPRKSSSVKTNKDQDILQFILLIENLKLYNKSNKSNHKLNNKYQFLKDNAITKIMMYKRKHYVQTSINLIIYVAIGHSVHISQDPPFVVHDGIRLQLPSIVHFLIFRIPAYLP